MFHIFTLLKPYFDKCSVQVFFIFILVEFRINIILNLITLFYQREIR